MAVEFSQQEADALRDIQKEFLQAEPIILTDHFNVNRELISIDRQESFVLTLRQGRIDLKKITYNTRHICGIVLVRLDITQGQHTNPDGTKIIGPHIHVYTEGYGDCVAIKLPDSDYGFTDTNDYIKCLGDFFDFCHIEPVPIKRQKSLNNFECDG